MIFTEQTDAKLAVARAKHREQLARELRRKRKTQQDEHTTLQRGRGRGRRRPNPHDDFVLLVCRRKRDAAPVDVVKTTRAHRAGRLATQLYDLKQKTHVVAIALEPRDAQDKPRMRRVFFGPKGGQYDRVRAAATALALELVIDPRVHTLYLSGNDAAALRAFAQALPREFRGLQPSEVAALANPVVTPKAQAFPAL